MTFQNILFLLTAVSGMILGVSAQAAGTITITDKVLHEFKGWGITPAPYDRQLPIYAPGKAGEKPAPGWGDANWLPKAGSKPEASHRAVAELGFEISRLYLSPTLCRTNGELDAIRMQDFKDHLALLAHCGVKKHAVTVWSPPWNVMSEVSGGQVTTAAATKDGLGEIAHASRAAPSVVRIEKREGGWRLLRDGQPYFVKGAVVGGGGSLDLLQQAGGNSIRTHAGMLDEAQRRGFTALVGLPLGNPRHAFDYADTNQVERQFLRAQEIVRKHRDHPALLMWNLGNEPEIHTTAEQRVSVWREANRLAEMVKREDPNHPVMVVIGGQYADMLHELNDHCPALDLVGLNSYAQMLKLPEEIAAQGWKRPYVVTEFGPRGHWQVPRTAWKMPIEDDAADKADFYRRAYGHAVSGQPACLGSYVFYWAHKQEKTHTWYGMFLPDGSRTPAIDMMTFLWSARWPANRCPALGPGKLRVTRADGSAPEKPGEFAAGEKLNGSVDVSDPDNDPLRITWELRPDVADNPNVGGDWEPAVEPLPGAVLGTRDDGRNADIELPAKAGRYRLFVYAHDGHGNATTANLPLVTSSPTAPKPVPAIKQTGPSATP